MTTSHRNEKLTVKMFPSRPNFRTINNIILTKISTGLRSDTLQVCNKTNKFYKMEYVFLSYCRVQYRKSAESNQLLQIASVKSLIIRSTQILLLKRTWTNSVCKSNYDIILNTNVSFCQIIFGKTPYFRKYTR